MKQTSFDEFKRLTYQAHQEGKTHVPVSLVMPADMLTPVMAYCALNTGTKGFLLESVSGGNKGRWSLIGTNPFATLSVAKDIAYVQNAQGKIIKQRLHPLDLVRSELASIQALTLEGMPPFCGGLVGYFGYETKVLTEPTIPLNYNNPHNLPDINLMYIDEVVAFDHVMQQVHIVKLVNVTEQFPAASDDYWSEFHRAELRIKKIAERLHPVDFPLHNESREGRVTCNKSKEEFMKMVETAKHHIKEGDIFQVVLARRFNCRCSIKAIPFYRFLRMKNPSPWMFLLDFGAFQLVGSSPERLVEIDGRRIITTPIAGTVKRGATEEEDVRLAEQMLNDPKERAEHMMLVDLARNDLGSVCEYGSVSVLDLMRVERYSSVSHIVTDVGGTLRNGISPLDAVISCAPAGTLSGAPKIEAMKIIARLENERRGPYGGFAGFFGFNGTVKTAIVIRTAILQDGSVSWTAGAGIVADSDPEREFHETENKGKSILAVLESAGALHPVEATA